MEIVPLLPVYWCILASGMTAHVKGQELRCLQKVAHFLVTSVLIVMKSADIMLGFQRCTPILPFALDLRPLFYL